MKTARARAETTFEFSMMEREDMDRWTGIKGGNVAALAIFLPPLSLSGNGLFHCHIVELWAIFAFPRDCP